MHLMNTAARVVAGLAVVLAMSLASQADAAEGKGTVKGKVIGKDGAGVAGAQVRLMNPPEGKGKNKKGEQPAAADEGKGDKGKGKRDANLVARTTSEADGSFTLADVPAGDYLLTARVRGENLQARQKVSVKADETLTVELKLSESGGKKKKKE